MESISTNPGVSISMSPSEYKKMKKKLKNEYLAKQHRLQEGKSLYKNTKEFRDQLERFMTGGKHVGRQNDERTATDCDIMETVN